MENETNTLDQGFLESNSKEVVLHRASSGKRFVNMIIDGIFFYIFLFILAFIIALIIGEELTKSKALMYLIFFIAYFTYYVILENSSGKTIGKMITKTRVVNIGGEKPASSTIWLRTLCRIIPFEAFSFLGSSDGLHDRLSKTIVIDEKLSTW